MKWLLGILFVVGSLTLIGLSADGQVFRRRPVVRDPPPAPVPAPVSLQALIDSGTVIPPGTYPFSTPLTVPAGRSLTGSGPNQTTLVYTGPPTDGGAIQIPAGGFGFSIRGLSLWDQGKRKQGAGIRAGATDRGQSGTQAGMARIDDVWIDGFQYGMRFGDKSLNTSCSEVTLTNVKVSTCDVGVRIETQNSLDYTFVQLGLTDCRVGIETDGASMVHVVGGSCSYVSEAVVSLTGAGVFSVRNLRTEGCGYLLAQHLTGPRVSVVVDSCETNDARRPDGVDVLVSGGACLVMTGGTYAGNVRYEPAAGDKGYGSVTLMGVGSRQNALIVWPGQCPSTFSVRDCYLLDANFEIRRRCNTILPVAFGTAGKFPIN